jgi:16S rRNA (guanine527-N7)-methyltransferase
MVTPHMEAGTEKPLAVDVIRRALGEYQISADDRQIALIQEYIRILRHWNDKLNLTAIREPLEILHRHFCESMFGAVSVPISGGRLADIGSGPGFPGIPIKILRPELELILVESNIKKGTFLAEIIRDLELGNARVLISRYEELDEELAPLDFVCCRAVGEFGPFLKWAARAKLAANQLLLWIGGRDLDEVRKSEDWEWREPILVPQSLRRFILAGTNKLSALRQ